MREALKLKPLCTSYLFSAALLGAVLALTALLPTVANAKKGPPEQVTLCHRPGTPAEKTLTLPSSARDGHLGHGDTVGACDDEGATCPCAASGSALELNEVFLNQEFDGDPTAFCRDDVTFGVVRYDNSTLEPPSLETEMHAVPGEEACEYQVRNRVGQFVISELATDLTPGEAEACREDIGTLMAELDDCLTP